MAKPGKKTDAELLAELEAVCARLRGMLESVADATARRDSLILDLRRRGLSLRRIATAAHLNHTRIRQITEEGKGGCPSCLAALRASYGPLLSV